MVKIAHNFPHNCHIGIILGARCRYDMSFVFELAMYSWQVQII